MTGALPDLADLRIGEGWTGQETHGVAGPALRRFLLQTLVRTVLVVVPGVLSQHLSQVPLAEDQHMVQALTAKRAHGTGHHAVPSMLSSSARPTLSMSAQVASTK